MLLQVFPEALVSVFGVFLIATGKYHGGKNIARAMGIVAGDKPDSQ